MPNSQLTIISQSYPPSTPNDKIFHHNRHRLTQKCRRLPEATIHPPHRWRKMNKCTHHKSNPELRIPTRKAPFLKPKGSCDSETGGGAVAPYKLVPEFAPSFSNREEVLTEGAINRRPIRGRGEREEGG